MESCGTVERRWKHSKPNGRHDRLSNRKGEAAVPVMQVHQNGPLRCNEALGDMQSSDTRL